MNFFSLQPSSELLPNIHKHKYKFEEISVEYKRQPVFDYQKEGTGQNTIPHVSPVTGILLVCAEQRNIQQYLLFKQLYE